MVNQQKWSLLSLAASLALAGMSIAFSQSLPYAATLIGTALLLVLVTAIWSAWDSFPRIFTDTERPKQLARSIYHRAALKGGTIHSTHIFPVDRNPEDDFAIAELSGAGHDVEVAFNRILLLDSLEDERAWLQLLFDKLGPNVAKRFYTLSSYPLLLPRIAKAIIPRLNLILYQSPNTRGCQVFVGLDRLHLAGVSVNFALNSRSKRVYRTLLRYFDQITGSPHFRSCTSLQEYDGSQAASTQVQRGQAVVSRAVDCAETTRGIVFLGLFGSIARAALGLMSDATMQDSDADVDLLIVYDPRMYPGTEEELRERVKAALDPNRTHVSWGPDLSVFYPFRHAQRIDVDIECLPVGADFYRENLLLGNSIFRYFMPLYSADQKPITSYLDVPIEPLAPHERWHCIVSSRQGLKDFKNRLASPLSNTDPRRLISQVLRNMVWAITGSWPTSARDAGRYLMTLEYFVGESVLPEAIQVLNLSTQDVRSDLQQAVKTVITLIQLALNVASSGEEIS